MAQAADPVDEFLATLSPEQQLALLGDWSIWRRPNQAPPEDEDWLLWIILSGRGWGKTRIGSEEVRRAVNKQGCRRIHMVARTAADARDTMVEGDSGVLAVCSCDLGNVPQYIPSKRRIEWPNGAQALLFSGEKPDALRGPQCDFWLADELASWRFCEETYDMLQFGARLGERVRGIITTTPKPVPLLKKLINSAQQSGSKTRVTHGHTYDNAANLAPSFILEMKERYEGTRLGMQELEGKLISDDPMALWHREDIENNRVREPDIPHLITMGVGVDPAMTSKPGSDATGIVIVGMDSRRPAHYYVLNDVTANRASPDRWGRIVVAAYEEYKILCAHTTVFPEVNNGGEMVTNTLRTIDEALPIDTVYASVGKDVRANPVVALYEQGRVHHVGTYPELEDEMCQWVPGESKWSPNRLDALVWAITGQMQKNRGFALPLGNIIPPV